MSQRNSKTSKNSKPSIKNSEEITLLVPLQRRPSRLNKSHLETELNLTPNEIIDKSDVEDVESPTLLFLYMMLAGLISHLPMFMMLSEVHIFNKKFKKFNFGFFVMMPSYASIPYSLLGSRFLKGLSITKKIEINLLGSSLFMALIYIFYFFVPFKDEYTSKNFFKFFIGFLFVLGFYFCAYVFLNMLQSIYVGFVGNFHERFSSIYYTFQPCSYLLVMIIKTTVYYFGFRKEVDVKKLFF